MKKATEYTGKEVYVIFNGQRYLFRDVEFEVAGKKYSKRAEKNLEECLQLGCTSREVTEDQNGLFYKD